MTMFAIEADLGKNYIMVDAAAFEAEAEEKRLSAIESYGSEARDVRICKEDVPFDFDARFAFVVEKLQRENLPIDEIECDVNEFNLHLADNNGILADYTLEMYGFQIKKEHDGWRTYKGVYA